MTTTTTTTETRYQYHIREWKEFVKYEWDQWVDMFDGETPADDITDWEVELAETYWAEFEETAYQMDMDPSQIINYSAGVFLGEVEEIIGDTRITECDWYDMDNNKYTPKVDMIQVALMASNADKYADECEYEIKKQISKMGDEGTFLENIETAKMIDMKPAEFIGSLITSEMNTEYPELLEVLAQWNTNQTMEQVIDSMNEATVGTLTALFEEYNIQ